MLAAETLALAARRYLPLDTGRGKAMGSDDWFASPIRAPAGHARLPRALVVTAEFDPLGDQGRAYAAALGAAGVAVTSLDAEGTIHAFYNYRELPAMRSEFLEQSGAWLWHNLHGE